jgi:hypothetical protein
LQQKPLPPVDNYQEEPMLNKYAVNNMGSPSKKIQPIPEEDAANGADANQNENED